MRYLIVAVALLLLIPTTAFAGQQKYYVCHRTASETNPYVLIHVASPAKVQAHLSGEGKGHYKTRVGQDYIPTSHEIKHGCGSTPPPPKDRFAAFFKTRVCGDPRLLITINNRRSTVPVTYRFWFTNGRGEPRTFAKTVPAGERNVLMPRWVKGRSYLRWTVSAPGFVFPAVVNSKRLPASTPWGEGYCPTSLKAAQRLARLY